MTNRTIDSNLLKQFSFIALILFLGIVLFRELWFFFPAFLGAVTFYVVMRPRMFYLIETRKWKRSRAAAVLILLSFFVILVTIGLLGNILYSKVSYVVAHSGEVLSSLKVTAAKLSEKLGYRLIDPNSINQLGSYLAQLLPKVLGLTFNTITLIVS